MKAGRGQMQQRNIDAYSELPIAGSAAEHGELSNVTSNAAFYASSCDVAYLHFVAFLPHQSVGA
jgi:hypothetical protein